MRCLQIMRTPKRTDQSEPSGWNRRNSKSSYLSANSESLDFTHCACSIEFEINDFSSLQRNGDLPRVQRRTEDSFTLDGYRYADRALVLRRGYHRRFPLLHSLISTNMTQTLRMNLHQRVVSEESTSNRGGRLQHQIRYKRKGRK